MLLGGIGERIAVVTLTFSLIATLVVAIGGVAERTMEPAGAPRPSMITARPEALAWEE
jgi:hypothetical protein